jgi:hypothetical protein
MVTAMLHAPKVDQINEPRSKLQIACRRRSALSELRSYRSPATRFMTAQNPTTCAASAKPSADRRRDEIPDKLILGRGGGPLLRSGEPVAAIRSCQLPLTPDLDAVNEQSH